MKLLCFPYTINTAAAGTANTLIDNILYGELLYTNYMSDTGVCAMLTYRFCISYCVSSTTQHIVQCPRGTGTGPKLVSETLIYFQWNHYIKRRKMTNLRTATKQPLLIHRSTILRIHQGALCNRVWFGIIFDLAVNKLVGNAFINCMKHGIFPSKYKALVWPAFTVPYFASSHRVKKNRLSKSSCTRNINKKDRPDDEVVEIAIHIAQLVLLQYFTEGRVRAFK